jgi:hypothetical protein
MKLTIDGRWRPSQANELIAAFGDGMVIWRDLADGDQMRRLRLGAKIKNRCSAL